MTWIENDADITNARLAGDWSCRNSAELHVPTFVISIGRLFTARSRIAEDALSGAVDKGTRQVVILGAGLDTFAFRSPHGTRRIRTYEVEHPATQAWKRH
jgi:O-methyltransferase involved in polyketide biosynthesis